MSKSPKSITSININNNPAGIVVPSNNFLGLLPLPYSISALRSSLLPSLSSSYVDTYNPQILPINNDSRTPSDSNKKSNQMSSSTFRRTSSAMPKPPLFNQTREKERFELSTLNDKFADYVEKVRYLEAQNKKIQMDTNLLSEKQRESCQKIKTIFETEIAQIKELAEKLFKDKNTMFTNSQDAQNSIPPLKQRLTQTFKDCDSSKYETEKIERQLSSVDGDILMYKRRLAYQENEHTQWKQLITHIQRLLLQVKNEIHNEVLAHQSSQQTIKQIQNDLTRLREQQQQRLKELKQSSFILNSNSTNDRAHMFKSELSNAIRRIRQDFEKENDLHRNQLYGQFTQSYDEINRQYPELGHLFLNEREQERIKQEEESIRSDLQRIRTDSHLLKQKNSELKLHIRELQINLEMSAEENKRIQQFQQNEINQFKLKHDKTTKDYEEVITKQTTLEKEIETYRNLLEGTMKPVVDHITDEYNTMTNKRNDLANRKTRSESVDRMSSTPLRTNTNETTTFISSMTLNNNKNQSTDSVTLINDNGTAANANDIETTKSVEDLNAQNNDSDLHIVEKNSSSPPNIRPPIIIQTRRNN